MIPMGELITPQQPKTPQTDDRQYKKLGWTVLALFIGIFVIWGSLAPLSSAVSAPGKVMVASNNRIIQHLEGGIVQNILVKDGDIVKNGQVLIELDNTQAKAQLGIAEASYYQNLALESRLLAERDRLPSIVFSPELDSMLDVTTKNLMVSGQVNEFIQRRKMMSDNRMVLVQRIEQLKNQIIGLKAIIDTKTHLSASFAEEIKEWDALFKEQLVDKLKLRDMQRQKLATDGEIANAKADIAKAMAQIGEMRAQIISEQQKFDTEVVGLLSKTQGELADLRSRIKALKDTLSRTRINAPVDGVVANLQVHTIGGVIAPGNPLLEIVPNGDALIIEGKVAANEVTNVRNGLQAEIRFPNFAHVKSLNIVKGEVIYVAADAIMEEKTQALYYPVKIRVTPEGMAELSKNQLKIQSGMPTDTMIVIASRTFMDYMIKPLKDMFSKGFNEQ